MADKYLVPQRLDDPELIGFWTIDEFAGLLIPFAWGILAQHIFIGIALARTTVPFLGSGSLRCIGRRGLSFLPLPFHSWLTRRFRHRWH